MSGNGSLEGAPSKLPWQGPLVADAIPKITYFYRIPVSFAASFSLYSQEETKMKTRIFGALLMSAALMFGASKTPSPNPAGDAAIAAELRREIVTYGQYTVLDDVAYRVTNGQVDLTGVVTDPGKKNTIEKLAHAIRGVTTVNDNIQALPGSPIDNQLGRQGARAIYGSPVFDHYAYDQQEPVRILVDQGHVTLEGVVQSQLEKEVAGLNAGAAGLQAGPVVNNLRVVPAS
jgi:hyperosmotically inducible periplasmic protein